MAGPFFFAWTDYASGAIPTFGPEHQVEDEEIVSFKVEQKEGDAATLSMDVRNPKIGLLAPGRPIWGWLSYDGGTATGGVVPLYFGRLIGIPTNILSEVVTLSFVSRPVDFLEQKFAFCETLKVLPWYDPIFIDPKLRPGTNTAGDQVGDPDVVLEAYSQLWHIDRLTLEVTTSDILVGEDGLEIFNDGEIPYDSVQIELGQAPLTSVHVSESVDWSQAATGQIDFGYRWFQTQTGQSIISAWPKTGAQLAGGWSVVEGYAIDSWNVGGLQAFTKHFTFENREKSHTVGDVMSTNLTWTEFPIGGQMFISNVVSQSGSVPSAAVISYDSAGVAFDPYAGIDSGEDKAAVPMHVSYSQTLVPFWLVNTKLVLGYNAGGKRNETADFTLIGDLQQIVTLPDPNEVVETLELNGTDVGLFLDGEIPIIDTTRNAYFPTDRGQESLKYGVLRARAHVLMRSRAVNLSWDCEFDRAINLTCRMNAQITDNRIPGGVASGKIIAYSFGSDGDAASMTGNVTIGCPIGRVGSPGTPAHAETVTTVIGIPAYVDTGYVADPYQTYSGSTTAITSPGSTSGYGDVGYSIPVIGPGPLITQLTREQVTVSEGVRFPDGYTAPVQIGSDTDRRGNTIRSFAIFPIMSYYLELLPVDNLAFDNLYDVNVTTLGIPKGIDLEAATTL